MADYKGKAQCLTITLANLALNIFYTTSSYPDRARTLPGKSV